MSKRQQNDGSSGKCSSDSTIPEDKKRKAPAFRNVVLEVMRKHSIQNFLEPMIRRVVKEEVELALKNHVKSFKRNSGSDIYASGRSLKLKFMSTLTLPVFTGTRIEGEDSCGIKVALVDTYTEEIIRSGPVSSAKVEIVVLEGDFDGDDGEKWAQEEFNNNIVKEREGKKPLLSGDVYLTCKEGVGVVGDICFTDNSSWTRSRRFRLGARLAGNIAGVVVREAKTESFVVRDHRGELYKKHYPPSLYDEVWRLEKIGKDGAFHKRLSADRVSTVKDFLILLNLDHSRLRKILGSGMSAKMWEVTVEHALTCVIDKKVYLYYSPGTQPIKCVVFNIVGQILGLLTESQYLEAQKLAISAFQNWGGVTSFEDESSLLAASTTTSIKEYQRTETSSHNINNDCTNPSPSSSPDAAISPLYSMECLSSSDNYGLNSMDLDLGYDDPLSYPSRVMTDSLMCDTDSIVQAFCDNDQFGLLDMPSQIPGFDLSSILQPPQSSAKVAQKRWRLVFNVLQWFFLLRGVVGRRSRGGQLSRCY
ncbi:hypothetical protein V2J09_006768 [Rumex salicifolius]